MTVWRLERGRALRTVATALAVCLGYYAGANLAYHFHARWRSISFRTTLGAQTRYDTGHVDLWAASSQNGDYRKRLLRYVDPGRYHFGSDAGVSRGASAPSRNDARVALRSRDAVLQPSQGSSVSCDCPDGLGVAPQSSEEAAAMLNALSSACASTLCEDGMPQVVGGVCTCTPWGGTDDPEDLPAPPDPPVASAMVEAFFLESDELGGLDGDSALGFVMGEILRP